MNPREAWINICGPSPPHIFALGNYQSQMLVPQATTERLRGGYQRRARTDNDVGTR